MYRITYEQGNGYTCGCCSSSWTETEEVETKKDVIYWLSELEADKKERGLSHGDSWDRKLVDVVHIADEDYSFCYDPKVVESIINGRRKAVEDKEAKAKADKEAEKVKRKKAKEINDRKKLKELAEKYPEELK